MAFFSFRQNNSGGSFHFDADRGISVEVIIEADSAVEANRKAEGIGIYFDGSIDCPCCGNRWSDCWSDDEGTTAPEASGDPVERAQPISRKWAPKGFPEYFVHYADGTVKGFCTETEGRS